MSITIQQNLNSFSPMYFAQYYAMTYKMLSEDKLSQAEQKNLPSIGIKSFYSNTSYGFEYKKNCIRTSSQTTFFVGKQLSSDITRFFAGRCPMSGANIQACYKKYHINTGTFSVSLCTLVKIILSVLVCFSEKFVIFCQKIFSKIIFFYFIFFIFRLCFFLIW